MRKSILQTAEIDIELTEDDLFALLSTQHVSEKFQTSKLLPEGLGWNLPEVPFYIKLNIKCAGQCVKNLNFMKVYLENRDKANKQNQSEPDSRKYIFGESKSIPERTTTCE